MTAQAVPDLGAILRPLLAGVAAEERPLMLAIAERLAAERYRRWARETDQPDLRPSLLACAAREDEIASVVENLYPDASAVQARLRAAHPTLATIADQIFGERPLAEQFAVQAAGERAGATVWRALAAVAPSEAARIAFLACAPLEEESATFLESLSS